MDVNQLKELAKKASPGPWHSYYHNRTETWAITFEKEGCDVVNDMENVISRAVDGSSEGYPNHDYIAAANPQTVLKLIAVVEAAEKHCISGNMPEGFVFTKDDQETYEALDQALVALGGLDG